jgi:hypothetical protein
MIVRRAVRVIKRVQRECKAFVNLSASPSQLQPRHLARSLPVLDLFLMTFPRSSAKMRPHDSGMASVRRQRGGIRYSAGAGVCLAWLTLTACERRPEGWSEATHGEQASPNYDLVFPRERVITLDIQIAPQDWQAMFDDMTEMAGAFGQGGTGNPQFGQQQPPPQPQQGNAALACVGKAVGDACTVGAVTGRCVAGGGVGQLCVRRSSPSAVARAIRRG